LWQWCAASRECSVVLNKGHKSEFHKTNSHKTRPCCTFMLLSFLLTSGVATHIIICAVNAICGTLIVYRCERSEADILLGT
jgi:hypothetical protein